jgi:hypothetical protein
MALLPREFSMTACTKIEEDPILMWWRQTAPSTLTSQRQTCMTPSLHSSDWLRKQTDKPRDCRHQIFADPAPTLLIRIRNIIPTPAFAECA